MASTPCFEASLHRSHCLPWSLRGRRCWAPSSWLQPGEAFSTHRDCAGPGHSAGPQQVPEAQRCQEGTSGDSGRSDFKKGRGKGPGGEAVSGDLGQLLCHYFTKWPWQMEADVTEDLGKAA